MRPLVGPRPEERHPARGLVTAMPQAKARPSASGEGFQMPSREGL
jgi:hypothetical protein